MHDLLLDIRYALRVLWKSPALAVDPSKLLRKE
jgi:hypothetical protein